MHGEARAANKRPFSYDGLVPPPPDPPSPMDIDDDTSKNTEDETVAPTAAHRAIPDIAASGHVRE